MNITSIIVIITTIIIIRKNFQVCQHVVPFAVSVDFVIELGVCQSTQTTRKNTIIAIITIIDAITMMNTI